MKTDLESKQLEANGDNMNKHKTYLKLGKIERTGKQRRTQKLIESNRTG